jgi:plasmid maintenance system antidote protein VapI
LSLTTRPPWACSSADCQVRHSADTRQVTVRATATPAEEHKRLGFTQAGLAEIMGVSAGRVSQIEHGEVATVEALAT